MSPATDPATDSPGAATPDISADRGREPVGDGTVELTLPAETRHLRLVRLAVSGFTADLGAPIEDIDDLRLAVGEACALLVEHAPVGARLTVTYLHDGGSVTVQGRCPAADDDPLAVDPVAEAVLGNTVDSYSVRVTEAHNTFSLHKRLRS